MSDETFLLRERARQRRPEPTGASVSVSISARRRTRSGDRRNATSTSPATTARPRNSSVAGRLCPGGRCARTTVRPSAIRIAAVTRGDSRLSVKVGRDTSSRLDCIDRPERIQENGP